MREPTIVIEARRMIAQRDRLWCRAIIDALDGDTEKINAVMSEFNSIRPDKCSEPMLNHPVRFGDDDPEVQAAVPGHDVR